jgi:hypothetical protein
MAARRNYLSLRCVRKVDLGVEFVGVRFGEPGNAQDGYVKVHNAFMMFRQGNHFPDFYTDAAERLLDLNQGAMPAQFIGPKLLTALHYSR